MSAPTLMIEYSLAERPAPPPPASVVGQLSIVREMLGTLETLTPPGQRHVMDKVVGLIRGHIWRPAPAVSARNHGALVDLLGHLTRESEHKWPDPRRFADRADSLVTLLAATA